MQYSFLSRVQLSCSMEQNNESIFCFPKKRIKCEISRMLLVKVEARRNWSFIVYSVFEGLSDLDTSCQIFVINFLYCKTREIILKVCANHRLVSRNYLTEWRMLRHRDLLCKFRLHTCDSVMLIFICNLNFADIEKLKEMRTCSWKL